MTIIIWWWGWSNEGVAFWSLLAFLFFPNHFFIEHISKWSNGYDYRMHCRLVVDMSSSRPVDSNIFIALLLAFINMSFLHHRHRHPHHRCNYWQCIVCQQKTTSKLWHKPKNVFHSADMTAWQNMRLEFDPNLVWFGLVRHSHTHTHIHTNI